MMAGLTCRCDNCIIQTMVALQFLSCICNIVACLTQNEAIDAAADLTDLIADIVWCAVCGCMQTQVRPTLKITFEEQLLFPCSWLSLCLLAERIK